MSSIASATGHSAEQQQQQPPSPLQQGSLASSCSGSSVGSISSSQGDGRNSRKASSSQLQQSALSPINSDIRRRSVHRKHPEKAGMAAIATAAERPSHMSQESLQATAAPLPMSSSTMLPPRLEARTASSNNSSETLQRQHPPERDHSEAKHTFDAAEQADVPPTSLFPWTAPLPHQHQPPRSPKGRAERHFPLRIQRPPSHISLLADYSMAAPVPSSPGSARLPPASASWPTSSPGSGEPRGRQPSSAPSHRNAPSLERHDGAAQPSTAASSTDQAYTSHMQLQQQQHLLLQLPHGLRSPPAAGAGRGGGEVSAASAHQSFTSPQEASLADSYTTDYSHSSAVSGAPPSRAASSLGGIDADISSVGTGSARSDLSGGGSPLPEVERSGLGAGDGDGEGANACAAAGFARGDDDPRSGSMRESVGDSNSVRPSAGPVRSSSSSRSSHFFLGHHSLHDEHDHNHGHEPYGGPLTGLSASTPLTGSTGISQLSLMHALPPWAAAHNRMTRNGHESSRGGSDGGSRSSIHASAADAALATGTGGSGGLLASSFSRRATVESSDSPMSDATSANDLNDSDQAGGARSQAAAPWRKQPVQGVRGSLTRFSIGHGQEASAPMRAATQTPVQQQQPLPPGMRCRAEAIEPWQLFARLERCYGPQRQEMGAHGKAWMHPATMGNSLNTLHKTTTTVTNETSRTAVDSRRPAAAANDDDSGPPAATSSLPEIRDDRAPQPPHHHHHAHQPTPPPTVGQERRISSGSRHLDDPTRAQAALAKPETQTVVDSLALSPSSTPANHPSKNNNGHPDRQQLGVSHLEASSTTNLSSAPSPQATAHTTLVTSFDVTSRAPLLILDTRNISDYYGASSTKAGTTTPISYTAAAISTASSSPSGGFRVADPLRRSLLPGAAPTQGHIAFSVNVNLPSLVVKRLKRFGTDPSGGPSSSGPSVSSTQAAAGHTSATSRPTSSTSAANRGGAGRFGSAAPGGSGKLSLGHGFGGGGGSPQEFAASKQGVLAIETFITTSMGKRRFESIVQQAYLARRTRSRRGGSGGGDAAIPAASSPLDAAAGGPAEDNGKQPQFWDVDIVIVYDDPMQIADVKAGKQHRQSGIAPPSSASHGSGGGGGSGGFAPGLAGPNSSKAAATAAAEAGKALMHVLERVDAADAQCDAIDGAYTPQSGGGIYFINGGLQAAIADEAASGWLRSGPDDAETPPLFSDADTHSEADCIGSMSSSNSAADALQIPLSSPLQPRWTSGSGSGSGSSSSRRRSIHDSPQGVNDPPPALSLTIGDSARLRDSPIGTADAGSSSLFARRSSRSSLPSPASSANHADSDTATMAEPTPEAAAAATATAPVHGIVGGVGGGSGGTFATSVVAGRANTMLAPPTLSPSLLSAASTPGRRRTPRPALARLDTSEKVMTFGLDSRQASANSPRIVTTFSSSDMGSQDYSSAAGFHIAPPADTSRATLTTATTTQEPPSSFQALCRQQAQHPPSPSSFGVHRLPCSHAPNGSAVGDLRRASEPHSPSCRKYASDEFKFSISCILPNFLYLGPDIQTEADVAQLSALKVRRILNMAMEIEDGGKKGLRLRERFDKYLRIPMRDTVEATGVQRSIEEACRYIDDARLHSTPIYVHCKAGKSRSVLAAMAYLIHANHWTLKRTYAYVVECRNAISPNIGFVAELMKFEEKELGLKKPKGLLSGPSDIGDTGGAAAGEETTNRIASSRSSLPARPTPKKLITMETVPPSSASSAALSIGTADGSTGINGVSTGAGAGADVGGGAGPQIALVPPRGAALPFSAPSLMMKFAAQQEMINTETEFKGDDGRYRSRRPPVSDLHVPSRRTTMAGIDSDNLFAQLKEHGLNMDKGV